MKQMTLQLDSRQQRPVVRLKNGLRALLDTGAYIPVWTDDEDILVENLGATMFQNLIYEVDDKNHRMNIMVPDEESMVRSLRIEDSGGQIHILCNSA